MAAATQIYTHKRNTKRDIESFKGISKNKKNKMASRSK